MNLTGKKKQKKKNLTDPKLLNTVHVQNVQCFCARKMDWTY